MENDFILVLDFGGTQAQAMAEYGCMRLAARIADLKRQGHAITATTGHGKNRYGESTAFAIYRLTSPSDIARAKPVAIRPFVGADDHIGPQAPQEVSADG